jgi:hypothetical protein
MSSDSIEQAVNSDLTLTQILQESDRLQQEEGFQKQAAIIFSTFRQLYELGKAGDAKIDGQELYNDLETGFSEEYKNTDRLLRNLYQLRCKKGQFLITFYQTDDELKFGTSGNSLVFDYHVEMKLKFKPQQMLILATKGVYGSRGGKRGAFNAFPLKSGHLNSDGTAKLTMKISFATKAAELDLEELF